MGTQTSIHPASDVASTRLDLALAEIHESFGINSVMRGGKNLAERVEAIPTGSTALDKALGIGGLPRGKQTEVFGVEGAGKTTLALHVVANAQAKGLTAAYIDVEHALDPHYAEAIGVDMSELLLAQPASGEETCEVALKLVQGGVAVVVVDSIAALATRAELAGEIGEAHMGGKARLMGQALRKIAPAADETGCCCVWVNQIREKIGVMFGSPEFQPGGRAMKYAAAVRIDLRRKDLGKRAGHSAHKQKVLAKVVKNKCAAPYTEAEYWLEFGKGIVDVKGKR